MRLKRYNEAVAYRTAYAKAKSLELLAKKSEFEKDYSIVDVRNWTTIIEDMNGIENFEIGEIDLLKLIPSLKWYTFEPDPGYYIKFEVTDLFDREFFNNELKVLRKMLYNNGLDIIGLEEAGEKDHITLYSTTRPEKTENVFLIRRIHSKNK
jgi:hypothetical protein